MAVDHFRVRQSSTGLYLLDCHRANGIAPVDGCRFCALLNRPQKVPAPSHWRPSQDKGGTIKARLGPDPMPEWGADNARNVLAAAYGDSLADAVQCQLRGCLPQLQRGRVVYTDLAMMAGVATICEE